jgi:hypothetical protein
MQPAEPEEGSLDGLIERHVPGFEQMAPEDQARLREMAVALQQRGLPTPFVGSSLRASAAVLRDLRDEDARPDNVLQRETVRRFIEQNAVSDPQSRRYNIRRERKREEKERLQAMIVRLLREARVSRGRHEVKKTRNMLLKVDQREVRRVLGKEGDDLCRQINTWLRSTSEMF